MTGADAAGLRRQLMRAMVAGLGVAALTGAVAIFTRSGWVIGRIAGTAVVLAVATAFALTVVGKLENPKTTRAASIGLWIIAASAAAFLVAIWGSAFGFGNTDRLWFSAFAVAVGGGIAALMVQALVEAWSRVAGVVGLMMDAVTLVLALVAIWAFSSRVDQDQLAETAIWIGCVMPVICGCLVGAFTDRRHWRWIGVVAAAMGCALGLHRVWVVPATGYYEEPSWVIQLMVIGGVVAHAVVIDRVPLRPERRWVALCAMFCAIGVGALMSIITWQAGGWERMDNGDLLVRAFMAAAFVGSCATLAVPVVYGMERRKSVLQSAGPMKEITAMGVTCPHCREAQEAPVGTSRCVKCGLMISIAVAEPKCEGCGYSLLDIQGEVCPECGVRAPAKGVALVLEAPAETRQGR